MPKALVAFIYTIFFILFAVLLSKTVLRKNAQLPFYWFGLFAKIFVGLVFAYISQTIYSGDSLFYFQGAKVVVSAFGDGLSTGFDLLALPARSYNTELSIYTSRINSFYSGEGFFMSKVTGFFTFLSFGNYYATTLWFALISFLGSWALYKTFLRLYPNFNKALFLLIFFLPSVIFWGTGILKDTLTLASVEFIVWGIFNLFVFKRRRILSIVLIALSIYLIVKLKAYILMALIPAIALWMSFSLIKGMKNKAMRTIAIPVVIVLFVGGALIGFQQMSSYLGRYSLEKIIETAYSFQIYHSHLGEQSIQGGGSAYSLGDVTFTPLGILLKIPAAINVTLFRPYIWESRSIFIFMAFIEATFFMLLTIYGLFKVGLIRTIRNFFRQPELALCLTFALILAFAVGFTAFNFGALVRFKIPVLPFYALFWIILIKQRQAALASSQSQGPSQIMD